MPRRLARSVRSGWSVACAAGLLALAGRGLAVRADDRPATRPAAPATAPAATQPAAAGQTMQFTFRKPKDRVDSISAGDGTVVLQVHSESGIGGLVVTPGPAGWPKRVVVRMMRFQMLEMFGVEN